MELWRLPIIDGPVPWVVHGLAIALLIALAVRRWTRRAAIAAGICAIAGAVVGFAATWIVDVTSAFGDDLAQGVGWCVAGALAASGFALGGMRGARLWRKIVAIVAVAAFLLSAAVGINAIYGIDATLGDLFGVQDEPPLPLPSAEASGAAPAPDQPISTTWTPPAGMPAVGERGSEVIPGSVSGFDARPAGIYLPPAALVADPPPLPLVIMMMGHPGNPDPTAIGDVLDAFAARNHGLAPIVVVADQLGADIADTACADSDAYGNAETYVTVDVVAWAKANLRIIDDPAYWVIAGYSNGGGCAITFAAKDPQTWKNVIDVSGEEYPGSEQPGNITSTIYGGSTAAFEASKPVNIMKSAAPGVYDGMTAVITAGSLDAEYVASAAKIAAAAKSAGMAVTEYTVPGADHGGDAVTGGLTEGFTVLYPVLGLSAR